MDRRATVWITRDEAWDLGLDPQDLPTRIMDFKAMIDELLKNGLPADIIVLPFYWNFTDTVAQLRNRGLKGPIIICVDSESARIDPLALVDEGVIFLDTSRLDKTTILNVITFLQRCQDLASMPVSCGDAAGKAPTLPSRDPSAIRALFEDILKERSRFLVSCKFGEALPSLTVACEIIRMTGDVEMKLVLDNFTPREFPELYAQLGTGRPLSGFITRDGETIGFELAVESCRMGKITVFLPSCIFPQKREYLRVEPDPKDPVVVHILPGSSQTLHLPVRDVSEGGVGLVCSYGGLEEKQTYTAALSLPANQVSPSAILEPSQILPPEPSPPMSPPLLIGTAEVVTKESMRLGSFYYGLTLKLHASDLMHLQDYVFKRQLGILAALRNRMISSRSE